MSDYSDKSFKELYSEVVEYVKTLTTKWDPTVADEADPGVAILKASCLLFDKVNYRQNYRNAQNSVREVSDPIEGENLFYDLGYLMKKKKSATGNISVRYLNSGDESTKMIPLLTQFSDSSNSITFTSIRKVVTIQKGNSNLVEVQEGIPVRYEYLGRKIFTDSDLTSNLRLPLQGYQDVASNGVVICSATDSELNGGPESSPLVSDWLNVGDNIFTAVETSNLYSIARDSNGINYIQFYEDSLEGLSRGIKIWVLSSYGSAGNIPANRLTKVYSTDPSLGDTSDIVISHNEFTNGQDKESLSSAMENYYNSYGVNDSLVSARDYSHIIESIIGPTLERVVSKALISDSSGCHNMVEVLSKVSGGSSAIFVRYAISTLVSGILVNALKYSDDYYESFRLLEDDDTINFIKKAIFNKNVLSNDVSLVGPNGNLFNKYIFDFADLSGTVIVNSTETEDTIKEQVKLAISKAFNSRNLVPGEMISEIKLSEVVREGVKGIVDCSFYYKNHRALKSIFRSNGQVGADDSNILTDNEKVEVVARSVLKGDLPLFEENKILLPLGSYMAKNSLSIIDKDGSTSIPTSIVELPRPGSGDTISQISGTFGLDSSGNYNLRQNEFIQFYREAKVESQTYGYGIKPLLLYPQTEVSDPGITYLVEGNSALIKNSIIARGSVIYSVPGKTYKIGNKDYPGISEELLSGDDPFFSYSDDRKVAVKANKNYRVENLIAFSTGSNSPTYLSPGSVIFDGSYIEGKYHYALSLKNGENIDFSDPKYSKAVLRLKTGEKDSDFVEIKSNTSPNTVRLENFSGELNSNGSTYEPGDWGNGFSTETIVTLVPDQTVLNLSDKYKYGFITNHEFTEEDDSGYLLGEDEQFIFSDSDLLDFVYFGSGTLIKPAEGHSLRELVNRVSLDSSLSTQLKDLPFSVNLQNTEIYTFTPSSPSEVLNLSYNYSDIDSSSGGELNKWFRLKNEGIVVKQGEVEQTFNDEYRSRIGLVLRSGADKTLEIAKGQKLQIKYKSGGDESIEVISGNETYLSLSEPLYLNSATNQDLSDYDVRLKVYGVRLSGYSKNFIDKLSFNSGSGFKYEQKLVSTSSENSYFSLKSNGGEYLIRVFNKTSGDMSILSGYFTDERGTVSFTPDYDSNEIGILDKYPYHWGENNSSIIKSGEEGYIYLPERSDGNNPEAGLVFIVHPGAEKDGEVIIESQSLLNGFNPDLFFTANEDQKAGKYEEFDSSLGKKVLEKVTSLSTDNVSSNNPIIGFDFEYVGESQLKNPTESVKYYDTQHVLNKNILTVINLESLSKNLKIVRRTR